ncbi:MAG: hypothetical protein WC516_04435 [Patescibacteria group bacterium]|jgi:hypothetical protein
MNIFILDDNKSLAAQYHTDRHIVKMPLEGAQLLCNVHHLFKSNLLVPYKLTHQYHPVTKWVVLSLSNYIWLIDFSLELCKEYTFRYKKKHACQTVIEWCSNNIPNIRDIGLTDFVKAIPDKYKVDSVVDSYRNYYNGEKKHLFYWKNRVEPWWIEG